MKTVARVLLTLILVAAGSIGGYELWDYYMYSPWTRDARVHADVVGIAPDVAGYVDEVRVQDNQFVHKGDILIVLDRERYTRALATAEANVAARKADMDNAAQQAARRAKLTELAISNEGATARYSARMPRRPPTSRRPPTARPPSSTSIEPSCARRSTGSSPTSPSKSVNTLPSAPKSWR